VSDEQVSDEQVERPERVVAEEDQYLVDGGVGHRVVVVQHQHRRLVSSASWLIGGPRTASDETVGPAVGVGNPIKLLYTRVGCNLR